MGFPPRPHLLGIDDGPFEKHVSRSVPIVGVMLEGVELVEFVAVTAFPVDGEGVTDFLAGWVAGMRCRPALHGVLLGGITIAGLAVVDVPRLADALALPVLVVNRREPSDDRLGAALDAAGLSARRAIVARTPPARPVGDRLFVAAAGVAPDDAVALVRASRGKSELPEPLRVAHLIAQALARGESRGRP
jgi:endonuclease V-like protein UPF0215 family